MRQLPMLGSSLQQSHVAPWVACISGHTCGAAPAEASAASVTPPPGARYLHNGRKSQWIPRAVSWNFQPQVEAARFGHLNAHPNVHMPICNARVPHMAHRSHLPQTL